MTTKEEVIEVIELINSVSKAYTGWCPKAFEYYCQIIIDFIKSGEVPTNDKWKSRPMKKILEKCLGTWYGDSRASFKNYIIPTFGYELKVRMNALGDGLHDKLKSIIESKENHSEVKSAIEAPETPPSLPTEPEPEPEVLLESDPKSVSEHSEHIASILEDPENMGGFYAEYGLGRSKIKKTKRKKKNKKSKRKRDRKSKGRTKRRRSKKR